MPSIPRLKLPNQLPQLKSMCMAGQSLVSYDPETWELQYEANRYLAQVPEDALTQRYRDILFNMTMLVSRERDAIPINSVMSSWYWFRKEHQTRLEFALRGIDLPVEAPLDVLFDNAQADAPFSPASLDAGNAIYKYGKRIDIESVVRDGAIRISPASTMFENESREIACETCIPLSGDMSESAADYYVLCAASDWEPKLFAASDAADACLVIKNAEEFGRRLENAALAKLTGWRFFHGPVHYYDPYERAGFETIQAGISRHFRYACQREYRFLWMPPHDQSTRGDLLLNPGDMNALVELYINRNQQLP